MMEFGIVIWFISGLILSWKYINGMIKKWRHVINEGILESRNGRLVLFFSILLSPFFILSGLFGLVLIELLNFISDEKILSWWYK